MVAAFAGGMSPSGCAEFVFAPRTSAAATAERLGLRLFRRAALRRARAARRRAGHDAEVESAARTCARPSRRERAPTLWRARDAPAGRARRSMPASRSRAPILGADLDAEVLAETAAGFGTFVHLRRRRGKQRPRPRALDASLAVHVGSPSRPSSGTSVRPPPGRRLRGRGRPGRPRGLQRRPWTGSASPALPAATDWRSRASATPGGEAARPAPLLAVEPSAVLAVADRYWSYTQLGPTGCPPASLGRSAATQGRRDPALGRRGRSAGFGESRRVAALSSISRPAAMHEVGRRSLVARRVLAPSLSSPLQTDELVRPVGPLVLPRDTRASGTA